RAADVVGGARGAALEAARGRLVTTAATAATATATAGAVVAAVHVEALPARRQAPVARARPARGLDVRADDVAVVVARLPWLTDRLEVLALQRAEALRRVALEPDVRPPLAVRRWEVVARRIDLPAVGERAASVELHAAPLA